MVAAAGAAAAAAVRRATTSAVVGAPLVVGTGAAMVSCPPQARVLLPAAPSMVRLGGALPPAATTTFTPATSATSSTPGTRCLSTSPAARGINDAVVPDKIVQHAYTTGGKKYLPGFSFPAPRKLEQIIKYALLEREPPERIRGVWNEYHDARLDCVATTWSREEYEGIQERKRRCPRMVYPVLKGDGKYFTLLAEWQDKFCLFAFLDDYRRNPAGAEPYLSIALYDDFLARKGLVLVRGDFTGHLRKADAVHLLNLMRYFYFTAPQHVEAFNLTPAAFNFDAYLRDCPPPPTTASAAAKVVRDSDPTPKY